MVILQGVQRHTGLTHHFTFFLWRSVLSARVHECQKLKWLVRPVWHWTLRTAAIWNSWRLKGLRSHVVLAWFVMNNYTVSQKMGHAFVDSFCRNQKKSVGLKGLSSTNLVVHFCRLKLQHIQQKPNWTIADSIYCTLQAQISSIMQWWGKERSGACAPGGTVQGRHLQGRKYAILKFGRFWWIGVCIANTNI